MEYIKFLFFLKYYCKGSIQIRKSQDLIFEFQCKRCKKISDINFISHIQDILNIFTDILIFVIQNIQIYAGKCKCTYIFKNFWSAWLFATDNYHQLEEKCDRNFKFYPHLKVIQILLL